MHRGTDTGVLADALADLLAVPLDDPFADEVVAVPTRGVERWLAQRLSHRLGAGTRGGDGVCAGIRFLNPHSLVALVLGVDRDDPWYPDRLAWSVLRAIDESLDEAWAAPLAAHLAGDEGRSRRYAVARRLAGLFGAYAVQRPAVLADWRGGGSGDGLDGLGGQHAELPPDVAWQPPLWRAVLDRVDAEPPEVRHARVVAALREGGDPAGLVLPGRLSLFGHTRIAKSETAVLSALAEHRDVHLWLPQASPAAWERLAPHVAAGPVPRAEDNSAALVEHPLLASLGRDTRELQRTLAPVHRADDVVLAGDDASEPTTLLGWLQSDLRTDHVPTSAERAARVIEATDESIQVHACHGHVRQIDVLRDVVAGLLAEDPTLEPRDILVMCPDIDEYAPLVHAGFGLGEVVREDRDGSGHGAGALAHPAHRFRVMLADRSPRHTNPMLDLAVRVVELAGGRLTAGDVLDIARIPVVRRRFGFTDDDLDRLSGWVDDVAIRWGLDAVDRERFQLGAFAQNTWRTGLDQILVGAALDGRDRTTLGETLGLDDLDSGDVALAGRLAEFVARVAETVTSLRNTRIADDVFAVLRAGVRSLADPAPLDAWQVAQLDRELSRLADGARRDSGSTELALSDVHTLFVDELGGRATRSSFRTGTLTVCTMMPMRSVPHRVIALVGLDDGVFPRSMTPDGDDVLSRTPLTGERDARAEDRQLLLDAVMAARQTLVITYTGADEHSGEERQPAVPLGELLDAIRQTATRPPGGVPLVRRHPLQPHDPRNLGAPGSPSQSALTRGAPFTFDPAALSGAEALRERGIGADIGSGTRGSIDDFTVPALPPGDVDLDDLLRFLVQPAQAFLRQRLGLLLPDEPEEPSFGIPLDLGGLDKWTIGNRMLGAVLSGADLAEACRHEVWRGSAPPGQLGRALLSEVATMVERIAAAAAPLLTGPATSRPIDLVLPNGRRLVGTVPNVHDGRAVTVTYSSVGAKQRLRSWVTALALNASGSATATSEIIGQGKRARRPAVRHLGHGPVDQDLALATLADLVDVHDRGMRAPLVLGVKSGEAFAKAVISDRKTERSALYDADRRWSDSGGYGGPSYPGEQSDPAFVRVLGESAGLTETAGVPADDEQWTPGIRTRLGQFALRIWEPLLTSGAERAEWV